MGFTAGISASMGMGTPSYYIDSGGNQWDANTWVNFHFDSSGSMADIITPLTNAMTGAYFSSCSAAGQNGVKSTTSLRAELQDLYATGGIEGAPDWNTNSATNGADQYDLHINHRSINDEKWLTWPDKHYYNSGEPWHLIPADTKATSLAEYQAPYKATDTWLEAIESSTCLVQPLTLKDICEKVLKLDPSQQNRAVLMRLAGILSGAGWKKQRKSTDKKRVWVWSKS